MREFKDQIGFLTIAQNTEIDYLKLAYIQATNLKAINPKFKYAVLVDADTAEQITDQHRMVFDYVITLPVDHAKDELWKQSNEWQVFALTPFKETIKLESDLVFTRDITHWLDALRLKDICFSYHCRDYQGRTVTRTPYRQAFTLNNLPDIYTGMYYFRYSRTAAEFFTVVRDIFDNWDTVKENLIQCDDLPSTDLVMSIAIRTFGEEHCYIPTLDFFNFAHMKSGIQGWSDQQSWTDYVNVEQEQQMLRINNLNQYTPIHYCSKDFYD